MRRTVIVLALLLAGSAVAADRRVDGYMRQDGTYVNPYYRTTPDSRRDNNYGSRGQINPHTGQEGTRDPYAYPAPSLPALPDPSAPRRSRGGF